VLAIDIMFLSGIPFLVTISRDIHFGAAVALPKQSKKSITKALANVINNYKVRGFTVQTILGDGQFECLENSHPSWAYLSILLPTMNMCLKLSCTLEQ